ncbi:MAG: UvrD-helicase domain-containing protein [Acidimicrobiales bacterium]
MSGLDVGARLAARTDLDATVFLEAGAGSGKTRCLVDRFVALVSAGVPVERIAAITFTERAAAELADRIRQALVTSALNEAVDNLDQAAIGTLHSFARGILNAHPIEAGLPPQIRVSDEIASQMAFEDRWGRCVDRLCEEPDLEVAMRVLVNGSSGLRHLRDVAIAFAANWDLVAERLDRLVPGGQPAPVTCDITDLMATVDAVAARAGECNDASDQLHQRLAEISTWAEGVRSAPDVPTRMDRLSHSPRTAVRRVGSQAGWTDVKSIRDLIGEVGTACQGVIGRGIDQALRQVALAIGHFTLQGVQERCRAGHLEFHDLLVLARATLGHPEHGRAVRRSLRDRYHRLLLDEFQDTDPIQVDLARLIAADPDHDPCGAGGAPAPVEGGRLFFVGDPKQSIYRFRRADIGVFLETRGRPDTSVHRLSTNFRTTAPIVEWVNHTFRRLIIESAGSQPAYETQIAHRTQAAPSGPSVTLFGAAVHPSELKADGLRQAEATGAAIAARRAINDGWSVQDRSSDREGGSWRPARWSDVTILLPARTSLPHLERALEAEGVPYRVESSSLVYGTPEVRDLLMVARAVEYPTNSAAVVAALRTPAFGCGDDDLYTWKVLHRGGWDHQALCPADVADNHPVRRAMAVLADLHRRRVWSGPSEILEEIVRERRLMEVAFVHPRPRDVWRRLKFVVDQARAWQEAGGHSLREYLRWVTAQSAEGSRVVETVLEETDDDAVRILTIHGSKGLEFPITILSGLTTRPRAAVSGVNVRFPAGGDWELRLGKDVKTTNFDDAIALDEQMDGDEFRRLLYVGATRACDHLVVSVNRCLPASKTEVQTAAQILWDAGHDHPGIELWPAEGGQVVLSRADGPAPQPNAQIWPELAEFESWSAAQAQTLARANRRVAISATGLAAMALPPGKPRFALGSANNPVEPVSRSWPSDSGAMAVGRAVHGVLETVDLVTGGGGLPGLVATQAAAEGVTHHADLVGELVECALKAPLVRRAAERQHWRELYVGCCLDPGLLPGEAGEPGGAGEPGQPGQPVDASTVLEGFIDLVFCDDDGLVIVDYKTHVPAISAETEIVTSIAASIDGSDDPGPTSAGPEDAGAPISPDIEPELLSRYQVQLRAYAYALARVQERPIHRAVLLILTPQGAVELPVDLSRPASVVIS